VTEHLPSKCEALSLNPSIAEKLQKNLNSVRTQHQLHMEVARKARSSPTQLWLAFYHDPSNDAVHSKASEALDHKGGPSASVPLGLGAWRVLKTRTGVQTPPSGSLQDVNLFR
jgi:hypothetical protein